MKKEQDKSAIYLVGYRASGKTSVGRAVALGLSRLFVDTDRLVEESEGRSIASIFAESGEPVFRRLESEALAAVGTRVLEGELLVVATGGGIVLSRENVERKIVVSCNVAGRDLQAVVDDIRRVLDRRAWNGAEQLLLLRLYY